MSTITIKKISKAFGNVEVLKPFTETFEDGEFITLLGPSGCGKTTMLRLIAGFEKPNTGEILIGDKIVSGGKTFVPPEKRDIGMVFQSYAVWPHMNVFDNVAYPLKISGVKKQEIKERVEKVLEIVHLSQYKDRIPSELSGGQQQRVALGRALVGKPKLLLLDEPLSNLDAKLREEMRFEIKEIQKRLGITVVYVTHDQIEAMTMSDRIILINKGVVQQIGTPEEIYRNPANPFVANFVGRVNFIKGVVKDGFVEISNTGKKLPYDGDKKGNVIIAIRPEALRIDEKDGTIDAKLVSQFYLGDVNDCKVDLGNENIVRVIDHVETYGMFEENSNIKLRIKNFMVFDDDGKDYTKIIT
ncbi:ABC transporter ATP-binding protein [Parvimonas parva]|uniref:ABC transporter ATP-binding protein n=1 Tax=Parvimonas parva TaxID=2769485 RepID=A0ABS1C7N6_9FIRM|nr:ABC transporter ATP-binding protein [Parvimonas parva]MBK1468065.1 ABC transporter ATP-binding protein [Parvimonas parva]